MSFLEGFRGAATVSMQLVVDGVRTGGLIDSGNVKTLKPVLEPEKVEVVSRRRDTRGNALDTLVDMKPMKIQWTGDTLFKHVFDMLMLGTVTDYAGGSVTDEPAKAIILDEWLPFGDNESFPRATLDVLTDSTGVTTYVEDTDYEYRERDGAVKYLSTGTISLDDDLLGDLTLPASGYSVAMNTDSTKTVRMLCDGVNDFNDRAFYLQLHQVSAMPTESPDLVAQDVQEYGFEGTCEVPDGFSSPGQFDYID